SSFPMGVKFGFIGCLLFTLGFFSSCGNQQSHSGSQANPQIDSLATLRVVTYNIHHANPPAKPGVIDVEGIARVIKETGAELVALQEVDVNTTRSGLELNQAKKLDQLTDMHYFFSKSIDFQGGRYGNAVLSKFPIVDSLALNLPIDEQIGGEKRSVAAITVELPAGQQIIFASTHLGFKSETNRLIQIKEIKE